jgi:hypothetical protein
MYVISHPEGSVIEILITLTTMVKMSYKRSVIKIFAFTSHMYELQ